MIKPRQAEQELAQRHATPFPIPSSLKRSSTTAIEGGSHHFAILKARVSGNDRQRAFPFL
jgi:hypothetical protein